VSQLILSDVFLRFATTADGAKYDFPHARFRETLATDFFANEPAYESLLSHLGESQFVEVTSVFVERFGMQAGLAETISDRICGVNGSLDHGRLLVRCLKLLPARNQSTGIVQRLIEQLAALRFRSASLELPRALFEECCEANASVVEVLERLVRRAVAERDSWLFALGFPPLAHFLKRAVNAQLNDAWSETSDVDDFAWQLLGTSLELDPNRPLAQILHIFWPTRTIKSASDTRLGSFVKLVVLSQPIHNRRMAVDEISAHFQPDSAAARYLGILEAVAPNRGESTKAEITPKEWEEATPFHIRVWVN
jgi:hypothetical protein